MEIRQPAAGAAAAAAGGDGYWRKGPWTPQEDKLLIEHVNLHGDGRWNSVSKLTGLRRSGKSCRLRWVNYLRPDLKRGKITPEEELIIVELHALWGNRWSTIARNLPGRTDNEIKNYWRTHFKKSKPSKNSQRAQTRSSKHQKKKTAAAAAAGAAVNNEQQQQQEQMPIDDGTITTTTMLSAQLAEQAALEREIMAYMCVLQGTVVGGGRATMAEEEEEGGGGGGGLWGSLWNLEEDDMMMQSMT